MWFRYSATIFLKIIDIEKDIIFYVIKWITTYIYCL